MTRDEIQAWLNENVLGNHMWTPCGSNVLIVGFRVFEKRWRGKPTPSGWDNIDSVTQIGEFASFKDAEDLERERRERKIPNYSYDIEPMQVNAHSYEPAQGTSEAVA